MLDIDISPEEYSLWVEWRNGEKLLSKTNSPDTLKLASFAKCELLDDIKIITKFGYSYFEKNMQESGEMIFMEIYCKKCNKYTVWGYEHKYWSSTEIE